MKAQNMSDTLICYDITDPRRLNRLHRYLQGCAVALQYSVFLFTGDNRQLQKCLETARSLIDEKEDDLRAYPLPQRGLRARLGKPVLPAGIQWGGLPDTLGGQHDFSAIAEMEAEMEAEEEVGDEEEVVWGDDEPGEEMSG